MLPKKRTKLTGKFIEDLGWYNPHFDKFEIKKERINYWLSKGAQVSDTVFNLLVKDGLLKGPKKAVHSKKKKEKIEESKEESVQQKTTNQIQETKEESQQDQENLEKTKENHSPEENQTT